MRRLMSLMVGLAFLAGTGALAREQEKGTEQKTEKKRTPKKKSEKKKAEKPKAQ